MQTGPGRPRRFCSQRCGRIAARRGSSAATSTRRPPLPNSFAHELRLAIERHDQPLHKIANALARDGVFISPAALSAWQRGFNQPRRGTDHDGRVLALERELGLPSGRLLLLLGDSATPRRGRLPTSRPEKAPARPTSVEDEVLRLRSHISRLGGVDAYLTTAIVERLHIGPEQIPIHCTIKQRVRAIYDDVDCYWFLHSADQDTASTLVAATKGCRIGRQISWRSGLAAHELLFDRILGRGQAHVFEFTLTYEYISQPLPLFRRSIRQPPLEHLEMGVVFTDHPAQVWQCRWPRLPEAPVDVRRLEPRPDNSALLILRNPRPGTYGLRWEW